MVFAEHNDRIAYLKLRNSGGQLGVISAYAPHGSHEYELKQSFFYVSECVSPPVLERYIANEKFLIYKRRHTN